MNKQLLAYLQLMRPANIITAIADILLGVFLAFAVTEGAVLDNVLSQVDWSSLFLLVLATVGLYGGGVVFNDYFDAELDAVERPERPIPRGDATKQGASLLGASLLAMGVTAAFAVNNIAKHSVVAGPIIMGMCRAGNLLLGISVVSLVLETYWFLAFIPLIYIQGITLISRGEVNTVSKATLYAGVTCYTLVVLFLIALSFLEGFIYWQSLPFFLLFAYMVLPPAFKAALGNDPLMARKAVKAGVISMIILDATIVAGFAGWLIGLAILLLLPLSRWMAKYFAVT
jgi:4-hydroxybenzoate polyprenyltransferase